MGKKDGKSGEPPRPRGWRARGRAANVTAVCCGVYICLWLLCGAGMLVFDRAAPTVELLPQQAAFVGAEAAGGAKDGAYATTSEDAQMLLTFARAPVRRVLLEAEFALPPGELDAYYGFLGGVRRTFARPVESGYAYTLAPKRYEALRVDLGTVPGNTVEIGRVVLNPRVPAWRYFVPDARGIAAAVALPALASAVICYIMEGAALLKKRRGPRAESRQPSQGDKPDAE